MSKKTVLMLKHRYRQYIIAPQQVAQRHASQPNGATMSNDVKPNSEKSNYEKPELLELGVLSTETLSSTGSKGQGQGDDNGL